MPVFIFEVFDDLQLSRVKIDKELTDENEIPKETLAILTEVAKEELRE